MAFEQKYKKYKQKYSDLNDKYSSIMDDILNISCGSSRKVNKTNNDNGGNTKSPNWLDKPHGIMLKNSSNRGTGVFATRDFKIGDIVEKCPIIKIPNGMTKNTDLHDYVFSGRDGATNVVLGYAMMYNHSNTPNVSYRELDDGSFTFTATREIKRNEEIFDNYGAHWWRVRNKTVLG
uniref:SET domain protein n=1 Tax=Megaviridae environmental sample TaxID=1737588 RepID=A0A5J6VIR8_9VIRU|nr:MAG: SET domain protein [Megaviridae environmental sample]